MYGRIGITFCVGWNGYNNETRLSIEDDKNVNDDENNTNPRDYRVGMKNVTDETQITIRKTASFEDRFLALDRKRSLESFPDVDFKLTIFNGRVEGAITNNSDKKIEDAVAIIGEKFIVLGDIEPGQKVDVESKYACTWYNNYNNAITDISECEDEDTKKIRDNFYEMLLLVMLYQISCIFINCIS